MSIAGTLPPAASRRSLLALVWLNFFLAGMQAAFGPVAPAYLAAQGWTAKDIGLALSIGSIASLVSQVPGGELLDAVPAKRLLIATGVVTVAFGILVFYLWPSFLPVSLVEVSQGMMGGILGTGVVALSLGLVGHGGLADQLGKNQRFAAAGGVVVTMAMALVAYSESPWAMFLPVTLAVPVLIALSQIRADEIDSRRASGTEHATGTSHRARRAALLTNRRLLIFAACVGLFQVANASMLPLVTGMLAHEGQRKMAPLIATLIIVPQLVVVLLAPWVGKRAEVSGRKSLLLIGFAALPIRALLFALIHDPQAFILIQILDGITASVMGIMTPLVIADVTKGTGRFNLAQGLFGTIMGVGAAVSPALSGIIIYHFGPSAGFVTLASEGVLALLIVALFLPETKDDRATSVLPVTV